MGNDPAEYRDGLISLVKDTDLGDIIRPMVREIHLFDSYISGTMSLPDQSVLDSLDKGDVLSLRREQSRYEDDAIAIYSKSGAKPGFVPEKDTYVFARLMDAGKILKARVLSKKEKGEFRQISVAIFLVDL